MGRPYSEDLQCRIVAAVDTPSQGRGNRCHKRALTTFGETVRSRTVSRRQDGSPEAPALACSGAHRCPPGRYKAALLALGD
jgi:hypothetical protein